MTHLAAEQLVSAAGLRNLFAMVALTGGIFFMFLGMILSILGAIALPLALGQYVAHGEIRAAFRVLQWWRILKADKLGYFIGWVDVVGLMGVIYFIVMLAYTTLILCCFIPILMAPVSLYMLLVGAALFGQTYS